MSKTILIIDDSPFVAVQVCGMVTGDEYEVIGHAKDGMKGLELYQKLKPDFVILDIVMPGIDGIETAKLLLEEDSSAKIIMLSSLFDTETMVEVNAVGVKYLLPKPIDKVNLFKTLDLVGHV